MYVSGKKIIILCICIFAHVSLSADTKQYEAVIHIQTGYSHGKYSLEQIVNKAQDNGIDIIIPTDSALKRWEYGIYPFRKIIKKTVELPSVLETGAQDYLDEIAYCNNKYPDMLIIPGVEAAPHYWWQGSIWKKNLTLRQSNKHLLVIGLYDASAYEKMPLISNPHIWFYPYDPYHEDRYGEKPYQMLIDYVNSKGGVSFWAHPDSKDFIRPVKKGLVTIQSDSYGESLLTTKEYTGFAFFRQGDAETGGIGGYWDKALALYNEGFKTQPVWAIGEEDYNGPNDRLGRVRTIFTLNFFSREAVMNALKSGSFYSVLRAQTHQLILKEYYAVDGTEKAYSGEKISDSSDPQLYIKVTSSDNKKHGALMYVVCNRQKIMRKKIIIPFELSLPLKEWIQNKNSYVRVEIVEHESSRLITNPIFFSPHSNHLP